MPTKPERPLIHLRDVEADDLPHFFENQCEPVAVAMVGYQSRDRAAFDQHWATIVADSANLTKTIVVASAASADSPAPNQVAGTIDVASAVSADSPAPNQVAGNISSWTSDGKREVGYWLDRALWGRGIATAALTAFLRLEQTRPLHAEVAEHNAASIRVLQKCGFTLARPADEPAAATADDIPCVHLTLF